MNNERAASLLKLTSHLTCLVLHVMLQIYRRASANIFPLIAALGTVRNSYQPGGGQFQSIGESGVLARSPVLVRLCTLGVIAADIVKNSRQPWSDGITPRVVNLREDLRVSRRALNRRGGADAFPRMGTPVSGGVVSDWQTTRLTLAYTYATRDRGRQASKDDYRVSSNNVPTSIMWYENSCQIESGDCPSRTRCDEKDT